MASKAAPILQVIYPDFPLNSTVFFPLETLYPILAYKTQMLFHITVFSFFDAEQVYLKIQVTNVKNKEVTANPKPPTLEKNWSFKNPNPKT